MSTILERRKGINEEANRICKPQFFRLINDTDRAGLEGLLAQNEHILVLDRLDEQLKELIKIRNPASRLTDADYETLCAQHMGDTDPDAYGVWVYYTLSL